MTRAPQRRAEDVLEQWNVWRGDGATVEEAAQALGMKLDTFQTILRRARARGDDRGRYNVMRRGGRRPGTRPRFEAILAAWAELAPDYPGLTHAEAAGMIGCTRSSLSSTLSKARREGREVPKPAPYVDPTR